MSTELLTYSNNTNAHRSLVRDGVKGNYDVVFAMITLTRQTVRYNKAFQNLVNNILIENNLDAYSDVSAKFNAIVGYVQKHVSYTQDIAGRVESIKSANITLSDGYGDCDDLSILFASMLGVLGYEAKFVLANYKATDTQFSHIYVECYIENKRFVFDGAIPNYKLNDEIKPYSTKSFNIFSQNDTDTLSGIIKKFSLGLTNIYKNSLNAIPTLAGFMPLGFLTGTALVTGANLASSGLNDNLSANELGSKINQQLDAIILGLVNKTIAYDWAKVSAKQIASQLSTIDTNKENFTIIRNSIKNKLLFIENFSKANNYDITLNHKGMLLAGLTITSFIGYKIYKGFN